MADIVTALSSQTGIDGEMVKKGLGALLTFLQKHLPADLFSKLETAVPGGPEMLSGHEGAGSGLLGMVSGLAGKLFGSGTGHGLTSWRTSPTPASALEQIEKFLPQAFELLKEYLPADLLEKVKATLPTLATPAEPGGG